MNVLLFYGTLGSGVILAAAAINWVADRVKAARARARETALFIERVGSERVNRVPAGDVNEGDVVIADDDALHSIMRVHRYTAGTSGRRYVWLFAEDDWDDIYHEADVVTVIPREVMA